MSGKFNLGSLNLQTTGTIQATGGQLLGVTLTSTNYTVLVSDYLISVDAQSGPINITMPASPSTGAEFIVKDANGNAGTNNITILGNGHNVDGASSFVMTSNYESITLIYNGSKWSIV